MAETGAMKFPEEVSFAMETGQSKSQRKTVGPQKPPFRPAEDDSKPTLQDPIQRSDPIETEEAVLRLPPLPVSRR